MVIREIIKDAVSKLRLSNNDNPVFEAHQIIKYALNITETDLMLNQDKIVCESDKNKIYDLISRRIKCEPLQYILGTQEFMSLEFFVSKSVLIPRADTETLVEYVIEHSPKTDFSLLDIGTGTGCIPLSVAHFKKNAYITGIDISSDALNIAIKNCKKLSLEKRATFEKLDILKQMPKGKFDVITSNPPYIKSSIIPTLQKEVKEFEPHLALDGGENGLIFYEKICEIAPSILNQGGMLAFEIGYDQAEEVSGLMSENFENIKVIKDLCENDRVVVGTLK